MAPQAYDAPSRNRLTVTLRLPLLTAIPVAISLAAAAVAAQTVTGTVTARPEGATIPAVAISLLDSTRREVQRVTSDGQGRYTLRTGSPGRYLVRAQKLGFAPTLSRWLRLETGQSISYEIALEVAARQLDSVAITTRAPGIEEEPVFGMDPRTLIGDFVKPQQVELARAGASNYLEVIGRIPGIAWLRPDTLCVRSIRSSGCLEIFLDDIKVAGPEDMVAQVMAHGGIPVDQIHHMILLRESEAGVLFGTGSQNGVVLIYTNARVALDSLARAKRRRRP